MKRPTHAAKIRRTAPRGFSLLATTLLFCRVALAVVPPWCGDGKCIAPESCSECPTDCGPCEPRQLTSATGMDYDPAWSYDGQTIAFLSDRNGDGSEIFAVSPAGGDERGIARYAGGEPWQFTDVSWLGTTGDLLAVDMRGIWEVLRIQLGLGPELPIVRTSYEGPTPYMTPLLSVPGGLIARGPIVGLDGWRLAWTSLETAWSSTPCWARVYALRVQDGTVETLSGASNATGRVLFSTSPGGYMESNHPAAFSPDGREVAFVAAAGGWCRGTRRDVWVADLESGVVRRLTSDGESGVDHASVSWSSTNLIAFDAGGDLYAISPDGTDLRRLTDSPSLETDVSWAPDGNRLAYTSDRGGNTNVWMLDGAGNRPAGAVPLRARRSRRYIVVLKDGVVARARSADERVAAVNASATRLLRGRTTRLAYTYANTINGFAAKISRGKARVFALDPDVAYVAEDVPVHASQAADATCPSQADPPSWGLDRIDERTRPLDDAFRYPSRSQPVHVYVIDTGIRTTHHDFGSRAQMVFSYDGGSGGDCAGHGTHVSATIAGSSYGVAKTARVYGLKVLDCAGSGFTSDVIAAVDWVTANHQSPAVVNMSLGSDRPDPTLDLAVQRSIASGVTYVVAAGNENTDAVTHSPARVAEAITVGASDESDRRASYSNFGGGVDLFAPGDAIVSASPASDSASAVMSGTSMATPHVTGMAAAYLQSHPQSSPAAVVAAIVGQTTKGVLANVPSGTPNRLLFVFDQCGRCGDGSVNQAFEECDDGNGANGDGCETSCYRTRYPCDVACCDGRTFQRVWALDANQCAGFSAGGLCNSAGDWATISFQGTPVSTAPCPSQCGVECCSWSVSQRVGGIFSIRGNRNTCATAGQGKCGAAGSAARNVLFYPSGVGGAIDWVIPDHSLNPVPPPPCPSGP